MREEYLTVE
jgi:hypothetical protein